MELTMQDAETAGIEYDYQAYFNDTLKECIKKYGNLEEAVVALYHKAENYEVELSGKQAVIDDLQR